MDWERISDLKLVGAYEPMGFLVEKTYRTAPARLTSGQYSIFALFSDDIVSNIDTLQLSKSELGSLNVKIALQYSFKS
jgi:hypothetical protein